MLRPQRLGTPLSLIMLDLDQFKEYNDTFGHPAGDEILQRLGSTLRSSLRSHDVVARYGGEEFVILLPATGEDEAIEVAERLRRPIAAGAWPRRQVTASLGVGTIGPGTPSRDGACRTRRPMPSINRNRPDETG